MSMQGISRQVNTDNSVSSESSGKYCCKITLFATGIILLSASAYCYWNQLVGINAIIGLGTAGVLSFSLGCTLYIPWCQAKSSKQRPEIQGSLRKAELDLDKWFRLCEKGDLQSIQKVISPAFDINVKDKQGLTALHHAASKGNLALVVHLIHCGAKLDEIVQGKTIMDFALEGGNPSIVFELMRNKVDLKSDHLQWEDAEGRSLLYHAAERGNVICYKKILEQGGLYPKDKSLQEKFVLALVKSGCLEEFKEACKALSISYDHVFEKNVTFLHIAARDGHIALLDFLCEETGNDAIMRKDDEGLRPFDLLVLKGYRVRYDDNAATVKERHFKRLTEFMTQYKVDSNAVKDLLHKAVILDEPLAISIFTSQNIPIVFDEEGRTYLHLALELKKSEIINQTCSQNKDLDIRDENGNSLLLTAAIHSNINTLEQLVACGLELDNVNNSGYNCFQQALIQNNLTAAVKIAIIWRKTHPEQALTILDQIAPIQRGLSKSMRDKFFTLDENSNNYVQRNPNRQLSIIDMPHAIMHSKNDILEIYIECGALSKSSGGTPLSVSDYNPQSYNSQTHHIPPLHLACYHGNVKAMELLMNANVSTLTPNALGETPLHWAMMGGHVEAVECLLERVPQSQKHQYLNMDHATLRTPLLLAASNSNAARSVPLLIKQGVDIEVDIEFTLVISTYRTKYYISPLTFAIANKNFEAALLLVAAGQNLYNNGYQDVSHHGSTLRLPLQRFYEIIDPYDIPAFCVSAIKLLQEGLIEEEHIKKILKMTDFVNIMDGDGTHIDALLPHLPPVIVGLGMALSEYRPIIENRIQIFHHQNICMQTLASIWEHLYPSDELKKFLLKLPPQLLVLALLRFSPAIQDQLKRELGPEIEESVTKGMEELSEVYKNYSSSSVVPERKDLEEMNRCLQLAFNYVRILSVWSSTEMSSLLSQNFVQRIAGYQRDIGKYHIFFMDRADAFRKVINKDEVEDEEAFALLTSIVPKDDPRESFDTSFSKYMGRDRQNNPIKSQKLYLLGITTKQDLNLIGITFTCYPIFVELIRTQENLSDVRKMQTRSSREITEKLEKRISDQWSALEKWADNELPKLEALSTYLESQGRKVDALVFFITKIKQIFSTPEDNRGQFFIRPRTEVRSLIEELKFYEIEYRNQLVKSYLFQCPSQSVTELFQNGNAPLVELVKKKRREAQLKALVLWYRQNQAKLNRIEPQFIQKMNEVLQINTVEGVFKKTKDRPSLFKELKNLDAKIRNELRCSSHVYMETSNLKEYMQQVRDNAERHQLFYDLEAWVKAS